MEKTYEKCDHEWEDEEIRKEFVGRAGNSILGGYDHFKLVYLQRCRKCKKLNKV